MSAPQCTIEDVTDQFDPTEFDKALGDILIKHEGNTERFIATVFDFLKRKSNFFKKADAKTKVLNAFKEIAGVSDSLKGGFLGASSSASKAEAKPATTQPEVSDCLAPLLGSPIAGNGRFCCITGKADTGCNVMLDMWVRRLLSILGQRV